MTFGHRRARKGPEVLKGGYNWGTAATYTRSNPRREPATATCAAFFFEKSEGLGEGPLLVREFPRDYSGPDYLRWKYWGLFGKRRSNILKMITSGCVRILLVNTLVVRNLLAISFLLFSFRSVRVSVLRRRCENGVGTTTYVGQLADLPSLLCWPILAAYAHYRCTYAARTHKGPTSWSLVRSRSVRASVVRVRCEK